MKKTPLYERHLALGARIIEFGGWAMPLQYTGVIDEHICTRTKAGLFDVSHMGEIEIEGPQAFQLLQWVMTRNLAGQRKGQMRLAVMTREDGGIIDDVMIYRLGEIRYAVVTNAETKDKDLWWIRAGQEEKALMDCEVRDISARTAKIDLQGPLSQAILQRFLKDDLAALKHFSAMETNAGNTFLLISRSGYTGEDGFEIYLDNGAAGFLWNELLALGSEDGLQPIGLGARDTLRLEAGLMLYGQDLDETTTPWEVTYGWIVNLEKDFRGRAALQRQSTEGVKRKLIGFELLEKGVARSGYAVWKDGEEIGKVTSGTYAPTLEKAVGYAMLSASHAQPGMEIAIAIRDRLAPARLVNLPFYRRSQS